MPDSPNAPEVSALFTALKGDQRQELFAAVAARGPLHPIKLPSGLPAWIVTGYAEVRALLTDPRVVKGGWSNAVFSDKRPEDMARGIHSHMLNSDPPDHTRLRKLVTSAFTRRRVEKLIPRIQQTTDDLLTAAAAAGPEPVDLITALAYPLPVSVICDLIGIPETDWANFRDWTRLLVSPGAYPLDEYIEAFDAMLGYNLALIEKRRLEPEDDLLSDLIAARDNGDGLTEDELSSMIFLLLTAGHDTTVNLIGNGVRALLTYPEQFELLKSRPDLLEPAVEEMLRYDSPVQNTLPYRTTEPVEVGGETLPQGAMVFLALLTANRDERQFPKADELDIRREGAAHVAFGHGIHHCLGAPLARTEGRIVFGALAERFPRLRLAVPAEELTRMPSVLMNGLASLPVYLD
jgi:cytochrome P450